jgi:hypothetical protein
MVLEMYLSGTAFAWHAQGSEFDLREREREREEGGREIGGRESYSVAPQ